MPALCKKKANYATNIATHYLDGVDMNVYSHRGSNNFSNISHADNKNGSVMVSLFSTFESSTYLFILHV